MSTRLLALVGREFSAYFATPLAYLFLFAFQVLSGIFTFFVGGFYERGQADLAPFFDYHPWLYLVLAPAVSMRLWAEERRLGTQELLLTLPISLGEAVIAKFLAAWAFMGTALLFTFPLWVTVNWLGDPDNGAIFTAYLGSFLLAGAYLALGEAISATTSSQTSAFIITLAFGFLLTAAGTPAVLSMFLPWAPATLIDHVAALSLPFHFQALARGTLEMRDLVFFVLFILGWLGIGACFVAQTGRRQTLLVSLSLLSAALLSPLLPSLRLDLTEDKLYTLLPGTHQLLASLKEPVILEFYFSDRASRELPAIRAYARQVYELLKEYQRATKQLKLRRIEVEPFSTAEDQAQERGLSGVRLAPNVPEIYFGLAAISPAGRKAVIPFFTQERERYLEYDLTSLLVQVTRPRPPRIALYAEPDLLVRGGINPWNQAPQSPWTAIEQVAKFYAVTFLEKGFRTLPQDADLLLLLHPKELSEASLYAIDQFVLQGRPALIFVDPYAELDGPPRFIAPNRNKTSDLNRLFRAWGFECSAEDFVADATYATPVTVAQGRAPSPHLGLLSLDQNAFSEEAILAGLKRLVLSSAGAIRQLECRREAPCPSFSPLIQSSPQAMTMPKVALDYLFDPQILYEAFRPQGQRFTLAARIAGKFPSAFASPPEGAETRGHLNLAQAPAHLIVVGDSDLLADRLWLKKPAEGGESVPVSDNGAFLLSAIDYLTGHPELIAVHSRGPHLRPLTRVEALRRQAESHVHRKLAELETQLAATERLNDPEALTSAQRLRAEIRALKFQFNREVEALGNRLKLIHLLIAPTALTLLAYGIAFALRTQARRRPL
jgi:ABC-type uncharacterized transport system involved in gliding motility auxiliary subunit/ABC-type transport system involved in multi-copper enzyme maturation permease subunit